MRIRAAAAWVRARGAAEDRGGSDPDSLGRAGDVAIAISTSGTSPSVVRAVAACTKLRIHTIGLTGGDGGKLRGKVDYLLNVAASRETARIQETHILAGHVLCQLVDEKLYGNQRRT